MKKERTESLEYIAKKHKQEQEEYLKAGVVKRVALYARQSVDKKDSISIDTQLDACRRLLKENEPYKEYTDKGYSGKDTNRPAFQQMLKDLHAGKISKIIVYAHLSIITSRLSSSTQQYHPCGWHISIRKNMITAIISAPYSLINFRSIVASK